MYSYFSDCNSCILVYYIFLTCFLLSLLNNLLSSDYCWLGDRSVLGEIFAAQPPLLLPASNSLRALLYYDAAQNKFNISLYGKYCRSICTSCTNLYTVSGCSIDDTYTRACITELVYTRACIDVRMCLYS